MKAITLHQPWATLMAIGAKRIETRSWPTRFRGRMAIHAAKTIPPYAKRFCEAREIQRLLGWQLPVSDLQARIDSLPTGGVVGICRLVHCLETEIITRGLVAPFTEQEEMLGNYDPGRFGWLTEEMELLDAPIPVRGMQGLWEWTREASL